MSKYLSEKKKKKNRLKQLESELYFLISKIENNIQILNIIQQEYNNIFNVNMIYIKNNNNKYFDNNSNIQFDNNFTFYFCHKRDYLIPEKYQQIIDTILQRIDINDLSNCILKSYSINQNIKNIQIQIEYILNQAFNKTSKIIFSKFKQKIESQSIQKDNKYTYGYFKMKNDYISEEINLIFKPYESEANYLYCVTLPLLEEVASIYYQRNLTNNYDQELYLHIFKEEFYKLNPELFQFLNYDINCILLYLSESSFEIDYKKFNYQFGLKPLVKKDINLIVERIMLSQQLDNF